MPISRLLRQFDKGVEAAIEEYKKNYRPNEGAAFSHEFAGFTFYDMSVPEKFECLDQKKKDHPILWSHLHEPFAQFLRNDIDLKNCYAGFATFFTVNTDPSPDIPNNASMTIDVNLDAPGFAGLILSREQFENKLTIPLTSVCLNTANDRDFESIPIIFHWARPECAFLSYDSSELEDLNSWGHVYVNAEIPRNHETGLETDIQKIKSWGANHAKLIQVRNTCIDDIAVFDEEIFYRRLRKYQSYVSDETLQDADLATRLAWTVTYFAYGCEQYLMEKCKLSDKEQIDHLDILCAPASYGSSVSVALYVPVYCKPSPSDVTNAAIKILHLARGLGLPLEKLKVFSIGSKEGGEKTYRAVFDSITHELAKIENNLSDSWQIPFTSLVEVKNENLAIYHHYDQAKNWRVIVTPTLYDALADRRSLWIGKNYLGRIALGTDSRYPLEKAMQILIEKIVGSHIAVCKFSESLTRDFLLQPQWQSKVIYGFQDSCDGAVKKIMEVTRISKSYIWAPTEQSIPTALIFARMLSVALSNILEKTKPIYTFRVAIEEESLLMIILIENKCTEAGEMKDWGTEGVLKFLASSLEGGILKKFKFDTERNVWCTEFSVPAPFLIRKKS